MKRFGGSKRECLGGGQARSLSKSREGTIVPSPVHSSDLSSYRIGHNRCILTVFIRVSFQPLPQVIDEISTYEPP